MYVFSKKFWNNPWVITIGSGLALILIVYFFNLLFDFLPAVGKFILSILTYGIPLWILIILILIILFVRYLIKANVEIETPGINPDIKLPFLKFKELKFQNIVWRWEYEFNPIRSKYSQTNIRLFCPKCDHSLEENNFDYECMGCKSTFTRKHTDREHFAEQVDYLIRNGKFQNN